MDVKLLDEYLNKLAFLLRKNYELDEKRIGLRPLELRIIKVLYETKDTLVTASLLAKKFGFTIGAVMHKLEYLETNGFIEKQVMPSDMRSKYYSLTPKAIQIYEANMGIFEGDKINFLKKFGNKEAILEETLQKIIEFMEETINVKSTTTHES